MGYLNNTGLQRFWNGIKGKFVRTVNGVGPDSNGNVQVPGKVHFVNATDISWSQDGSSAQSLSDTTRAQILSWLTNGEFVVLSITTSSSDPMWLYPDNDDSGDIYFRSLTTADGASAHYYEADISDGSTESHCDIARITMNLVPSGGTAGQVLTKTASGYAWQSLPTYNGGVS